MPPKNLTCAGCSYRFAGKPGDVWCPDCRPTLKQVTIELTPAQIRQLEAIEFVRGVSQAEAMRQGNVALVGPSRGKSLEKKTGGDALPRDGKAKR